MNNSLQLRTSQQFALTPQLQQSLHFLQLSSLELEQTLNTLIIENPFLILEQDSIDESLPTEQTDHYSMEYDDYLAEPSETINGFEEGISEPSVSDSLQSHSLEELPLDSQWEDHYQDDFLSSDRHQLDSLGQSSTDSLDDIYQNKGSENSLKQHLLEQVSMTPFTEREALIAWFIIDALDEDGYLTQSQDEIIAALAQSDPTYDFKSDFNSVLTRIQLFDPMSIATFSLQERLLLQLKQLPKNRVSQTATALLVNCTSQLEKRDFRSIIKLLAISESELQSSLALLATLDPFLAKQFTVSNQTPIAPDIIVQKKAGNWQVQLNNSVFPKIVLDTEYVKMLQSTKGNKKKGDEAQKNAIEYLQLAYQSAKTVLSSLEGRYKTLLLVANQIVAHQIAFFEQGPAFLKPMTLADIANMLEMSESTISRACQNKYLVCPKGVFELKYFFTSHVTNEQGEEVSSTAIKSHIKEWIDNENRTKPLSDSKLETKLKELGFDVARRTVAKYREQLGFPSSHLRKTL